MVLMAVHGVEPTPTSPGTTAHAGEKPVKASPHSADRKIVREPVPIDKDEPLKRELKHFVDCVQSKREPAVSGASAKEALELALEITAQIQAGS